MTDTINDALECADRADAAARLRGEETTHGSRVLRRLVADLEAARAELAQVTAERTTLARIYDAIGMRYEDGTPYPADDLVAAIVELRDAEPNAQIEESELQAELAAARAAMPLRAIETCAYLARKSGELGSSAAYLEVHDWLDAYHAAHPAASPAAEVAAAFGSAPDLPEPCVFCGGRDDVPDEYGPCADCNGTGRAGGGGHE